jgi:hypothetical protein
MGHIRLGRLPRTVKWKQVVSLIDSGASTAEIALVALDASRKGLQAASKDPTLIYSVWLLTQIPLAAKGRNFSEELRERGLEVSQKPTLMEVVGAFTDAVDAYTRGQGARSDLGEMAQLAAVESFTKLAGEKTRSLFGATPEDVQRAVRSFSTTKQFGNLGRDFFSRFLSRYLTYFLSRELSNHVGPGQRFANIQEHSAFNQALDIYCRQAARIVQEFAGGWFSKTNYEGGIDLKKAGDFAFVALKKIRSELAKGEQLNEQ